MERIRCTWCGCFVSYKDIDNGEANISMITPDSDYSQETWETICKKCKNVVEGKNNLLKEIKERIEYDGRRS